MLLIVHGIIIIIRIGMVIIKYINNNTEYWSIWDPIFLQIYNTFWSNMQWISFINNNNNGFEGHDMDYFFLCIFKIIIIMDLIDIASYILLIV